MKSLFCYITIIVLFTVTCFSGCIIPFSSGDIVNEKLINGVVKALDNKDTKALKKLFSEDVIENDKDLDEQLENVINFYDGKSTSFIKTGMAEDSINKGTCTQQADKSNKLTNSTNML